MATELTMLAWAALLGFVYIFAATAVVTRERGMKWNASARDAPTPPLSPLAGRLARAQANFLETFPFFAAAVVAVVVAGRGSDSTALAAQAYVWSRLVYLPLYALGVPYLRSLVWLVSLASIVVLLAALL
ncbi:MAPEG family protein [Stenotrophomonas sp. 24(2023)]|uniref:MAPEG family protein n=1 Tax=Stenotrophomonas sp. 24(2023) TaxID=3068324 RepID=UPI0027DEABF5|nr:MAPEG family protein [Stenotrophomonas sp. 24(2023)]WMJ68457.1 MAPEG family protein [Stenotrophomonas sp. 24(2023)]